MKPVDPSYRKDVSRTAHHYHSFMKNNRREITYILRIWQEPSDLAPPGEWRGVLRSLDGRQERLFKSADELWDYLIRSEAPTQPGMAKPEIPPSQDKKEK